MARIWAVILVAGFAAGAMAAPGASTRPSAKGKDKDAGVPKALVDAAGRSFVKVHYHFRKDVTEEAGQKTWAGWRAQMYEAYVNDKITLDAVGIAIASKEVLVYDGGLEDRFIEKIEVVTADGKRLAATRGRLLDRAPLVTLKVTGKLTPLKFVKPEPMTLKTSFRTAGLVREGENWRLTFGTMSASTGFDPKQRDNVLFKSPGERPSAGTYGISDTSTLDALQIVADDDGRAVGVCADDQLDARQTRGLWIGRDLLEAPARSFAQLRADETKLRETLRKSVHEVKVKFHQGSRDDANYTGVEGRELSMYCMAISPRRALLPQFFSRKVAAKIDTLDIKYAPGKRARARFLGVYKEFGATLIELTKSDFPGYVQPAKSDPQRMALTWAVAPRERDGRTDVDLTLNRLLKRQRGYGNRFYWLTSRGLPSGTCLLTADGKLAGVQMRQRVEDEEQQQLAEKGRNTRSTGAATRLFAIDEIRTALTKPKEAFDPKIKVLPKSLAKRRHWFGVESVGLNKNLAEQMKVERPTKDGTVGFLISAVYDGSPAAEMGVVVGDILLSMRVQGQPYPVELKSALAGRDSGGYYDTGDSGPPSKTWKNRGNFMTKVLDAIGDGKTARMTYYQAKGGKIVAKDFVIKRAPPDFDSASKWKNRKIGLTVKDLTYEVRLALSLKADAPGVVISKIEPGSPANVARVWTNEIITAADDTPVTSARQLRDLIAVAAKAKKDKVRLTILRLGKTRFADLTVKAYDPADDEGLDED